VSGLPNRSPWKLPVTSVGSWPTPVVELQPADDRNRCVTVPYANSLGRGAVIEHLQLYEPYRLPLCLFADSRSAIQAVTSDSSQPTRLALIRIGAGKVPVRM
jgi:hypothetical protein